MPSGIQSDVTTQGADLATANSVLMTSLAQLSAASDMREFLAHVFAEILRVTGASNAAATRYDPRTNQLRLELFHDGSEARWGVSGNEIEVWSSSYDADVTPAFQIGLKHRHIFVASMLKDQTELPIKEFALPGGLEWMTAIGASDAAVSILFAGNEPVGTFHLHFTSGRTLRPDDLPLLNALSQQAAIALRLVSLADHANEAAVARERELQAEKRAEELAKANEALRQTSDRLAADPSIESFLGFVLLEAALQVGADAAHLTVYEAETDTIRTAATVENGVLCPLPLDPVLSRNEAKFLDILLNDRKPKIFDILVDADLFWPGALAFHKKRGHRKILSVPLMIGENFYGHLGLAFGDDAGLSIEKSALLNALSNQAAISIHLVRLSEQARKAAVAREQEMAARERTAELAKANEALQSTTDALASTQKIEEIVPAVLRIIARTFGSKGAGYYEIGSDGLVYLHYYLIGDEILSAQELMGRMDLQAYDVPRILSQGFAVDDGYLGAPVRERQFSSIVDHHAGTSAPVFDNWARDNDCEMELNLPLMVGSKPFAALCLYREAIRPYRPVEIELAEALVKQLSLAVQACRLAAESETKAVAIAVSTEQRNAAQERERAVLRTNESLKLSKRLLGVVAEVSTRLARIADVEASMLGALRMIGEAGQFSRVLVFEERKRNSLEEGSDHFVIAEWCAPGISTHEECGMSVIASEAAISFLDSLRSGRALWHRLEDVAYPLRSVFEQMGIRATGCAPLMVDGEYWGNVAFDDCVRTDPWDSAHVDALTAVAQAISNALQTQRDAERLASEREVAAKERVAALARANQALRSSAGVLSQSSSPEDVLSFVLQQTIEVTGADTATLVERSGRGDEFAFRTFLVRDGSTITNASDTSRMPRFHLTTRDDTYFSNLLQGKPGHMTIDDDVAGRCPASEHIFRLGGDGVMWAFPFTTQGSLKGYMALGFGAGRTPDSVGLETAEALACQASLVLETLYSVERTKILEAIRERDIAVQKERTRLSEEMHDGLQQTMSAISLQVGSALMRIGQQQATDNVLKALKRAAELAEQGLKEIRDSVRDLSAGTISDAAAFLSAVTKLCSSIDTDSTKCAATVTVDLNDIPRSNFQNIYRVLQEAAQNVVKHACARNVEIEIRSVPTSYVFSVTDDGCGIASVPAPRRGMGFQLMEERASRVGGRLEVEKVQTGGTRVSLTVPKSASTAQSDPSEGPA